MPSSSSTSSSKPEAQPEAGLATARARLGLGWLALVLLGVVLVESLVFGTRTSFLDSIPLMTVLKLERAETGPPSDVLILGDSQGLAALRPRQLALQMPGVEIYNYGLLGIGPSGGEVVLRRHLAAGRQPELVVLAFTPLSMTDSMQVISETDLVRYVYRAGDVARAVGRGRRAGLLLEWGAARIPSLRYRESLKSGAISRLVSWVPPLHDTVRRWAGLSLRPTDRFRMEWRYGPRSERNQAFSQRLERDAGWYYWREKAIEGERLPAKTRFPTVPLELHEDEARSLAAIVALCQEIGLPALALPAPLPRRLAEQLRERGDLGRFEALWQGLAANASQLQPPSEIALSWPHPLFADPVHVNPDGAERYTREMAPAIQAALEAARSGRP